MKRRRNLDEELREEIEFHLESRAEWNRQAGLDAQAAQRLAALQFGNATLIQEDARGMHVNTFLESVCQDLRYAWRGFARQPAFTAAAVLTMALGIGATTAVFSVVDRLLFRSLPYPDAGRLVSFGMVAPIEPTEFMLGADYLEWSRRQTPFAAMTSWSGSRDCDINDGTPVRVRCAQVEANFLQALGVSPLLGRSFTRTEDRPNAPPVVVLSYGLWRARFAGNPGVLGAALVLDGRPAKVVGVLPPGFEMPTLAGAGLLVPQALDEATARSGPGAVVRAFARLKPGVTIPQAQAALGPLFRESLKSVPAQFRKEVRLRVRSLRDRQIQDAKTASWVLLGAVLAVLLIACANVTNLMLARAASRRKELAIRAALGGRRTRLLRQALTEAWLLALLGGFAGVALAWALLRAFVAIAPQGIPRLQQAALDGRVLAFTLLATLATGLLFGLAPALEDVRAALPTGARATAAPRGAFRQLLVSGQIAASLVLLSAAGLLLRSLWNLQNAPLGMQVDHVLTVPLVLPEQTTPAQRHEFFEEIEARASRVPGVIAAAVSDSVPPAGRQQAMIYSLIEVEGRPAIRKGTGGMVPWRLVTPKYFVALGIPIRRGRAFQEQDRGPNQNPIVLSEALARKLFPGEDPLGRRLRVAGRDPWYTVIGVAGNVSNIGPAAPPSPEYYLLRKRTPVLPLEGARAAYLVVRTVLPMATTSRWLRAEIAAVDRRVPVIVEPMVQRIGQLAQRPKFNAVLLGLFAGMGLLLAAVGLYGVLAFLVAARRQEIGVRMALGAAPNDVAGFVLRQAGIWALGGAVAGLAGALLATRLLRSLLVNVPARDPATLAAALAALLLVAFAAAWIPSRRAARLDPSEVLRSE